MRIEELYCPSYEWQLVEASPVEEGDIPSNFYEGLSLEIVLKQFVERVRQGAPISENTLQLIADGVERHLNNKDCNPWPVVGVAGGRPTSKRPSDDDLCRAAEVQFYRRFLPEFNGHPPVKQEALARQFNVSVRMIRNLEAFPIPSDSSWSEELNKELAYLVFHRRIKELIAKEGIGNEYYLGVISPHNHGIMKYSE